MVSSLFLLISMSSSRSFGILERLSGFLEQRGCRLLNLLLGRLVRPELCYSPLFLPIRIDRFNESSAQVLERMAAADFHNRLVVFLHDAVLHAGEPAGDAGEHIFVGIAQSHSLQQLVKGDAGLLFHGPRIGLVLLADADGIDDDEVVFALASGVTALEVVGLDDAHAAAFHLLEEGAGFDGAHEEDDFQRLDVGAGGDHVHGDGDAG